MRNLKRALSLALALVMVMSLTIVGASAVSVDDFSDGADIVNTESVTVLASLNVINGKDDGSFDPTGIVTRAEMAKMICVVLNGGRDPQLGEVVADSYNDTVGHWAKSYIEYCTTLGIVAGRGDGTFAPNETVTMAEAAKMLLVAIGYNASIEGYTGTNWQINTDVAANQQDLYEGITAVNTSADLTRDNAAQMVYNALECQMVKYEYVVATDNGVVTTRPQITTQGLGNVLEEKFNAVKVEAIVEGNEYATVNSNNYASSEDAGETYLNVVSISNSRQVNASVPQDEDWKSADGVYDVATSKDLLGQRVVVYVRYKDTVGYDETDALVIGDPIPVSSNKVVVSTDGTEMADLLDDNKLEVTGDTVYLVNYGGYYGGLMYGGDPAETGVAVGDKDNDVTSMTLAQFDVAAQCVGTTVTLIDNNGDGDVDYALAEKYSYGIVNKDTEDAFRVQGLFNEDEYDVEDVVGLDDAALGDLVLFAEYGGKVYVEQPEQMEGKLDDYSTSRKNVTLDGETVLWSGLNGRTPAEVIWVGDYVTSEGVLNTTANFYKDNNGYIFAVGETDESLLTYAVLLGYENQTKSGTGLGTTARARLLRADGTVGTYDVATIGGKAVTNCTDGTGAPSKVEAQAGEIGFNEEDLYTIYSYSENDAGAMRLVKKTEAHIDGNNAASTDEQVRFISGTSNISYGNTEADPNMDDGSATVTERTIFLYERKDGTFSRYQGRTAPSIVTNNTSNAYDLVDDETFAIRVSTTGEALVVFLGNIDPISEWKDNWAFVYNTKVAQNGDAYKVRAIIDGVDDEYLVEQAYDDTDSDTYYDDPVITEDTTTGSRVYGHKIPYGLYTYTVDEGVYTLTKEHLGTSDDTGLVDAFRSSYIRVNNHSYTITDDTMMFEARKDKTVQTVSTYNPGDRVTVVYNDDNEAVYIFLEEFSYNLVDSAYEPVISGSSDVADKALDTDGGKIGQIALGTFEGSASASYQWYRSDDESNETTTDDVALTDDLGYTGAKTATLSVNEGTLDASDDPYYFYCVVSNTDPDGVTGTAKSAVIEVTVSDAPVEGALTLNLSGFTTPTVARNNANVTAFVADETYLGFSKGDNVKIASSDFAAGTYWTVEGLDEPVKAGNGMIQFTMPAADVTITKSTDQVVKYTLGEGVTLSGTDYDAATGFAPVGTAVTITVASANGTGVVTSTDGKTVTADEGTTTGTALKTGSSFTPATTDGDIHMLAAAQIAGSTTGVTVKLGDATGATINTEDFVVVGEKVYVEASSNGTAGDVILANGSTAAGEESTPSTGDGTTKASIIYTMTEADVAFTTGAASPAP